MRAEIGPGTELGGYRLESEIGRGGMGVVFLAEHLRLKRKVALKILTPDLGDDEAFRHRFIRESQLAASLDHTNVIPIYDADEDKGYLYIAMRYVAGTDLARLLRSEGRLTPERTLMFLAQVAGALDAAHANELVHRDVKPGNILIERTPGRQEPYTFETCYLADFGLTRKLSYSSLTNSDTFVGTIDYTTPEIIEERAIDGRTDVYSLGCVLYQCLTGSVPFPRESDIAKIYAHLQDTRPLVTALRPDLPRTIDQVVCRAMAVQKEDRFPTCGELVEVARGSLRLSANRRGVIQTPTLAITGPKFWLARVIRAKRARAWGIGAMAIIAVTAILFLLWPSPSPVVPGSGPTHIWALTFDRSERRATGYQEIKVGGTYEVEPAVSRDGKIAFTMNRGRNSETYVMDADGSHLNNLTRSPGRDEEPAWSPDGKSIAFATNRDGNFEIYVMDADGRALTRLTHDSAKELDPSWSPDGTRIAFSKGTGPRTTQIYVMNADGSGATQITSEGSNFSPAWSPEGDWIACVSTRKGDKNIYLVRPDGKGEPAMLTSKATEEYSPTWRPDSNEWLAYVSTRSGTTDIWVMDTVAQKAQDLTPGPEAEFGPVWSGDTIYYARTEASSP